LSKQRFKYTGYDILEAVAEAKNYNNYLANLVNKHIDGASIKVLDFGAGTGTYLDLINDNKVSIECLEPDSDLQRILTGKGYEVIDDIDKLNPDSYDLIYSLNVFEHIKDDFEAFEKLARALRSNGIIVVYVPAFQSLYSSLDKLVEHHRRYKKDRLAAFAKQNGLEILELHYCDPLGFFAAAMYKMTNKGGGDISTRSVKLFDKLIFPVSKFIEPIFKNAIGKNLVLVAKK
jgi:SAM-dependent methyltransferase